MGVLEDILAALNSIDSKLGGNKVSAVAAAVAENLADTDTTTVNVGTAPDAPVTATNDGTVEVDARSFPWDARIHASTKSKIKDLSWKSKRDVDPQLVLAVENEYRALGFGAPETPVPDLAPLTPSAQTGTPTLPGLPAGLPPIPAAKAPAVTVEMPVIVEGQEIDDNLIMQVGAAMYAKYKVEFIDQCFALLQMPEGSSVKDIDPNYRWHFYLMGTSEQYQQHCGLVVA